MLNKNTLQVSSSLVYILRPKWERKGIGGKLNERNHNQADLFLLHLSY